MTVIECHDLTKTFGSIHALDQMSFSIQENKITGLIGRNGAGKTTLLNILAGHLKPTSGYVKVFDQEPFNNLFVSSQSIFIEEEMRFPETLGLEEILNVGQKFYPSWNEKLAKRLFHYFSFQPNTVYHHLSKGRRSTFNMIFGLASRAPLTLFDEPTTGMDAAVRDDFYRALLKDYIQHPRTIILSSHHLEEAEHILEDILLIDRGKQKLHLSGDEMKEYAIGLSGPKETLFEWVEDKEVIHVDIMSDREAYVVIRNRYSNVEIHQQGFHISSVSPKELSIYITKGREGVIDDFFHEG